MMTTSVKERLKAELEQAQSESKQRAGRISDILKAAASMTFVELKEGSAELNVVTRKSVSDILTELQEQPEADVAVTVDAAPAESADAETPAPGAASSDPIPTWKSLLREAIAVVRDRRGDWYQSFKQYWQKNAAKADQEVMAKYGDRYDQVKRFFQRVVEQLKTPQTATQSTTASEESRPVSIEVVEGDAIVDVTPTVQKPTADGQG